MKQKTALALEEIGGIVGGNLATHDPYDLWKTGLGLRLRRLYYMKGKAAIPLVAPFYILDVYVPRLIRCFTGKQEYPIVRALAALSALNLYEITAERKHVDAAARSCKWLIENRLPGYNGACWGLNFPWMTKCGYMSASTPFVTHTPYCVEALLRYHDVGNDCDSYRVALSSADFLEKDLKILLEHGDEMALSYGPYHEERIVINANSYAMMLYALLAGRQHTGESLFLDKAFRLFNFVRNSQNRDGSWFYYRDRGKGNFIDCFHSCFVLKNLVKYGRLTNTDVGEVVGRGITYILDAFMDSKRFLARRFTVSSNPGVAKFDLYDQAELLNVLTLTGRYAEAQRLHDAIMSHFYLTSQASFVHQIDIFGFCNKMPYLRWAILPMIHALTEYYKRRVSLDSEAAAKVSGLHAQ